WRPRRQVPPSARRPSSSLPGRQIRPERVRWGDSGSDRSGRTGPRGCQTMGWRMSAPGTGRRDRVWEELAHVGVERIKRSDPAGLGELGGIGDVRLEHIWGTRAGDETLLELLQICSGVGREHLDRDFDVRVCLFEGTDGYLRLLALGAQTGLREDDRLLCAGWDRLGGCSRAGFATTGDTGQRYYGKHNRGGSPYP